MSTDAVIGAIYAQLDVPTWASRNLDALTDVLRDLSWLPEGPVTIHVPRATEPRVLGVLGRAVRESAGGPRAVHVDYDDASHTG